MASGKQLAFSFGEVSPALRYKVDAGFYGQGLSKLYNGLVRKAGGVSNRSGTKYIKTSSVQSLTQSPEDNEYPGARIFYLTLNGSPYVITLKPTIQIYTTGGPLVVVSPIILTKLDVDPILEYIPAFDYLSGIAGVATVYSLNLSKASISQLGDSFIITVALTTGYYCTLRVYYSSGSWKWSNIVPTPQPIGSPINNFKQIAYSGQPPADIPVSYLFTQEQTDGSEVAWLKLSFNGGHPHSLLSANVDTDIPEGDGVKQYNVYRSGSAVGGINQGYYGLVGRMTPVGNGQKFYDYVTIPDYTFQPPTDSYIHPKYVLLDPASNIRKILQYKQRTILIYNYMAGSPEFYHPVGEVGASKLGSPLMFFRPITPNEIDAFTFTVPQEYSSEILNALSVGRLILFTKDVTIAVRGGDNGVFTASNVNPEVIYNEGSTSLVEPVASGSRGYFISYDRTKLFAIVQGGDDNIKVVDISITAEHLFEARDIVRMAVIPGKENILWILKSNGTLMSITISDDGGILGYARHSTDGYIEDITVGEEDTSLFPHDAKSISVPTLYLSVIRNRVRMIEAMAVRDDIVNHRYMYVDSAVVFGDHVDKTSVYDPANNLYFRHYYFNIIAPDYSGGSQLAINDVRGSHYAALDNTWIGKKLDFFYDVVDEETGITYESKVRITITGVENPTTLIGVCEEDIPEALQNIEDKYPSSLNLIKRRNLQCRWVEAVNAVSVPHLTNRKVSVFADGKVISNPLSNVYDTLTVGGDGILNLPDYYSRIVVGLPYYFEMETLDLEVSDSRTLTDAGKLITAVGVGLYNTIGGYYGQTGVKDIYDMNELKKGEEDALDQAHSGFNGYYRIDFPSTWEKTGRVKIKQIDPLPITILAVYPKGITGEA